MENKIITKTVEGTENNHAITLNQLKTELGKNLKKNGSVQLVSSYQVTNDNDTVTKKFMMDNAINKNQYNDWNAKGRKIYHLNQDFAADDVVPDMKEIRRIAPYGTRDSADNFNCRQKVIYNNGIRGNDPDAVKVKWVKDRYVAKNGNIDLNNI